MEAIARSGASPRAVAEQPRRATPELDAQVRTCRAQLADWVTCPSAKTPQGKAKIEQISAKLDSIKVQIKKTDSGSPAASAPSDSAHQADNAVTYLSPPNRIGLNVDAHA